MRSYKKSGVRKIALGLCFSLVLSVVGVSQFTYANDWVYTVRKGDTLWGLCHQYTTVASCWQKIGPYNDVEYPRNLAPGTRIKFPVGWLLTPPVPASVSYVKGSADKVIPNELVTALQKGDALPMGTRILTGNDGLVLLTFADGSVMTIEPETELTLDALSGYKDTGMVDTRVHLKKGAVQTRVPKRKPRSNFEVSTPSSVAAVRGTDFRVSSVEGEYALTRNEVFSGAVSVANDSEQKELPKGTGLVAVKDQPLPDVVKLLGAPALLVEENTYAMPFDIHWNRVDGAHRYRIEIVSASSDVKGEDVTIRFADDDNYILENMADGCYVVRVSAVDSNALQGMPSEGRYCLKTPLAQPDRLRHEQPENGAALLVWDDVEHADDYRVEFSSDQAFEKIDASVVIGESSLALDKDKSAKYARVIALGNGKLESQPSDNVQIIHRKTGMMRVFVSWLIAVIILF
ncbi:MAG: FecR domain-containing protein [Agarilytica sp.]